MVKVQEEDKVELIDGVIVLVGVGVKDIDGERVNDIVDVTEGDGVAVGL